MLQVNKTTRYLVVVTVVVYLDIYSRRLVASWSWVVNATPRSLHCWEGAPVPIVREAGWAPGPAWTGLEKTNFLPPSWFEHRNVQAVTSRCIAYAVQAGLERSISNLEI
jgi:hypothetical protein